MKKEIIKKILKLRSEILDQLAEQKKEITEHKKLLGGNMEAFTFLEGREKQIVSTISIIDDVMSLKNIIKEVV